MITALQPERGNSADRAQEYHDLARAPRHAYIAFYLWLRHACAIDALIHLGAHGTLEWLPGKAVALRIRMLAAGADRRGAGDLSLHRQRSQARPPTAKRRIGALTIGHMTPTPCAAAPCPRRCTGWSGLLDEYSTADGLDPRRRDRLVDAIIDAAQATQIVDDLQITPETCKQEAIARVDALRLRHQGKPSSPTGSTSSAPRPGQMARTSPTRSIRKLSIRKRSPPARRASARR